jgi:hypothetical protein
MGTARVYMLDIKNRDFEDILKRKDDLVKTELWRSTAFMRMLNIQYRRNRFKESLQSDQNMQG